MVPGRRRWRRVRQVSNGIAAACAAAAVLLLCAAGYHSIPALGPALDPGHGAWASAAGGQLPRSQVLTLPGLAGPVAVSFDARGLATVEATHGSDAMLALGYLHARFRLTQMDLERRQAEGRLAQLIGPAAVPSDRFELRLGLLRTARQEWAAMRRSGAGATMLTAYAHGVNDYLAQLRASGQWPAVFSLAGVYPARWTPVDSLAVQGGLTQALSFTTSPLDYALLVRSLGIRRTMSWFPVLPPGTQYPYDPGPYRGLGVAPIAGTMTTVAQSRTPAGGAGSGPARSRSAGGARGGPVASGSAGGARGGPAGSGSAGGVGRAPAETASLPSAAVARAAATILAVTRALPSGQAGGFPGGSAWAVNGPKVAGGGSMLAGDAPLPGGILPPAWFQVAIAAPRNEVTGVSLPGMPGVVLGHNQHIAWSLAGAQNQSALFYAEKTSRSHPGQYFWRGRWLAMRKASYTIPVRGGQVQHLTVDLTVHGPVLTQSGQTISVDWMGNAGSPDVPALARIGAAANFGQFRAALAGWRAPALSFVYADDRGNIGAVAAGYYPVVRHGTPWLPMPGTGADDVAGVIPYAALPHSYDPPGHLIAAGSQRPVTATYPYYIGTTANEFDSTDRVSSEYAFLVRRSAMRLPGFAALQTSPADEVAVRLLPRLLAALRHARLTPVQRQAASLLRGWNRRMSEKSAAAAIWSTFWPDYLSATFEPWWQAAAVPVRLDPAGLRVSPGQVGLVRTLEQWTLTDPSNPAFSPSGGPARTATSVMRAAFGAAVAQLRARLGGAPSAWASDRLVTRQVSALARLPVLGYGSRAAEANQRTVDVPYAPSAGTAVTAGAGPPGWRMIVRLHASGGPGGIEAEGIYPGGQSENPASPWYGNLTARWQNGGYLPMSPADAAAAARIRWELLP